VKCGTWPALKVPIYCRSHRHCGLLYKRIKKGMELHLALEQVFEEYLMVSCWAKMYWHVCQWLFLGAIYLLYRILDGNVAQAYKKHWCTCDEGKPKITDGMLVKHLAVCFSVDSDIDENILKNYPGGLANMYSLQFKLW
jgi:hypothetical protein